MERHEFIVDAEDEGKRLDVFLAENLEEYSRSYLQKLIKEKRALIKGEPGKNRSPLKEGEEVSIEIPEPKPLEIKGENIPLEIIYEDGDLLVVNKPQGMVVHPGAGNYEGTMVNALLYHCQGKLSSINGVIRPGIVHRIDKDTSGLLMVAKTDQAHRSLQNQLKDRKVTRVYRLLVHGVMEEGQAVIDAPMGRSPNNPLKMAVRDEGRFARTHITVLERFEKYTLLEARLETGRTHQIRVHLQYIGHALVGDPVYGPTKAHFSLEGQMLHAKTLGFLHPRTGEEMEFDSPMPEDFQKVIESLRRDKTREEE
ncbi:RluA family pseudouridine synthase [Isachenkonia alkalipeptolytica]|uniref:Pseudouridine synthase n=1 Tax=Isachenkonia alkalipeptolytica TaxID=2565777 RepID=A0AA44BEM9_9CLOT|nr:RluA family pseudouridine synthase [Isachenkonia alkalipeptolytica]NBG89143.1 RluA family pseudouridine synthase [Isachenkonia alkalipeptolytica]